MINCRSASWFASFRWRRPISHRQMYRIISAARSERRTRPPRTWTRSRSPRARRSAPRSLSRWSSSWSRIDAVPANYIPYTASIRRRWAARSPAYRSTVARTWVRHPVQADHYHQWPPWAPTTLRKSGTKCRPIATGAYRDRGFSLSIDKVNYCFAIVYKYLSSIKFISSLYSR